MVRKVIHDERNPPPTRNDANTARWENDPGSLGRWPVVFDDREHPHSARPGVGRSVNHGDLFLRVGADNGARGGRAKSSPPPPACPMSRIVAGSKFGPSSSSAGRVEHNRRGPAVHDPPFVIRHSPFVIRPSPGWLRIPVAGRCCVGAPSSVARRARKEQSAAACLRDESNRRRIQVWAEQQLSPAGSNTTVTARRSATHLLSFGIRHSHFAWAAR